MAMEGDDASSSSAAQVKTAARRRRATNPAGMSAADELYREQEDGVASNPVPWNERRKYNRHLTELYDIEFMLGRGAFSTVWQCRHRKTQEIRALKKINTDEVNPREIAHEVAMMKLLIHRNVVRCYDVFLEAQYVNVVVDMFPGGDLVDGLNAHRKARGRIPDAQLANLARQMAGAIRHVHQMDIVHRDIKGENFVSDRVDIGDPECVVALGDFGTATRLMKKQTLSDKVGTPAFWAPEVFENRYDFKVDVWALGVTCYVLLTGALPMEGQQQICKPLEPDQLPFRVPSYATKTQVDFLAALMSKDPEQRPTAEEMCKLDWMGTPDPPQYRSRLQPVWFAAVGTATSCMQMVGQLALGFCECFGGICYELLADKEPSPPQSPSSAREVGAASSSKDAKPSASTCSTKRNSSSMESDPSDLLGPGQQHWRSKAMQEKDW